MRVGPGGFRLPKKPRTAAWRALAISVLALAFPAVAVARALLQRSRRRLRRSGPARAPARAVQARLGDSVLALGSGYGAAGGSSIVRVLQRDLDAAGYPPGRLDGLYGPRTRRAVVAFQAAHGLQVDGIVGPRTWAALPCAGPHPGPGGGRSGRRGQRRAFTSTPTWRLTGVRRARSMAVMACSPKLPSGGSKVPTACRRPGSPVPARSRFWPGSSHPSAGRTCSRESPRHRPRDPTSVRGRRARPWPLRHGSVERVAPTECSAHRPTGRARGA